MKKPYGFAALALLVLVLPGAPAAPATETNAPNRATPAPAGGGIVASSTSATPLVVALPAPRTHGAATLEETLLGRRSVRAFAATGLALEDLGQLLWAAQGVTSREGGRTAPSAGALYPLEIHAVVADVAGLDPGVYRYLPERHRLERLGGGDRRAALAHAALGQDWIAKAPVVLVIAADYARLTGKYRERGVRYAHLECGHAAQDVLLEAVALGLGAGVVGAFDDARVREVLRIPVTEQPLELIPVGRPER